MLPSPTRAVALLVASVALLAAACSPAPTPSPSSSTAAGPSVIPVIIGDQVKGPYRFIFSFLDAATNQPAAAPDRKVSVAFLAPGASGDVQANPATFMWTIEGTVGQYYLNTEFPQAGELSAAKLRAADIEARLTEAATHKPPAADPNNDHDPLPTSDVDNDTECEPQ